MAAFDPFAPPRQTTISFHSKDLSSSLPLPAGWLQHYDQSSGKPYFENQSTGITTWSRPTSHIAPQRLTLFSDVTAESDSVRVRKPSFDEAEEVESELGQAQPFKMTSKQPLIPPERLTLARLIYARNHGECLARVSLRTLLAKAWKPCFWVFDKPNVLLVFRERSHYLDYHANPYLEEHEREYMIKKRIVLGANQMCSPVTQKNYSVTSQRMLYHFTVEEQRDYGPAVLVKFGAEEFSVLEDLRGSISSKIQEAKFGQGPAVQISVGLPSSSSPRRGAHMAVPVSSPSDLKWS